MPNFTHSSLLFVGIDGEPMEFYMRPSKAKQEIKAMVEHGGGEWYDKPGPNIIRLIESGSKAFSVSDWLSEKIVSAQYIRDCVTQNKRLDVNSYVIKVNLFVTSDISDSEDIDCDSAMLKRNSVSKNTAKSDTNLAKKCKINKVKPVKIIKPDDISTCDSISQPESDTICISKENDQKVGETVTKNSSTSNKGCKKKSSKTVNAKQNHTISSKEAAKFPVINIEDDDDKIDTFVEKRDTSSNDARKSNNTKFSKNTMYNYLTEKSSMTQNIPNNKFIQKQNNIPAKTKANTNSLFGKKSTNTVELEKGEFSKFNKIEISESTVNNHKSSDNSVKVNHSGNNAVMQTSSKKKPGRLKDSQPVKSSESELDYVIGKGNNVFFYKSPTSKTDRQRQCKNKSVGKNVGVSVRSCSESESDWTASDGSHSDTSSGSNFSNFKSGKKPGKSKTNVKSKNVITRRSSTVNHAADTNEHSSSPKNIFQFSIEEVTFENLKNSGVAINIPGDNKTEIQTSKNAESNESASSSKTTDTVSIPKLSNSENMFSKLQKSKVTGNIQGNSKKMLSKSNESSKKVKWSDEKTEKNCSLNVKNPTGNRNEIGNDQTKKTQSNKVEAFTKEDDLKIITYILEHDKDLAKLPRSDFITHLFDSGIISQSLTLLHKRVPFIIKNIATYNLSDVAIQRFKKVCSNQKKKEPPFTDDDDMAIVKYIINNKQLNNVNSFKLWENMETANITAHSAAAMRYRFHARISKYIKKYLPLVGKDMCATKQGNKILASEKMATDNSSVPEIKEIGTISNRSSSSSIDHDRLFTESSSSHSNKFVRLRKRKYLSENMNDSSTTSAENHLKQLSGSSAISSGTSISKTDKKLSLHISESKGSKRLSPEIYFSKKQKIGQPLLTSVGGSKTKKPAIISERAHDDGAKLYKLYSEEQISLVLPSSSEDVNNNLLSQKNNSDRNTSHFAEEVEMCDINDKESNVSTSADNFKSQVCEENDLQPLLKLTELDDFDVALLKKMQNRKMQTFQIQENHELNPSEQVVGLNTQQTGDKISDIQIQNIISGVNRVYQVYTDSSSSPKNISPSEIEVLIKELEENVASFEKNEFHAMKIRKLHYVAYMLLLKLKVRDIWKKSHWTNEDKANILKYLSFMENSTVQDVLKNITNFSNFSSFA